MMQRKTVLLATALCSLWVGAHAYAQERQRTITYDGEWILHEFDAGIEVREDRTTSRRWIDDGTREGERGFGARDAQSSPMFGPLDGSPAPLPPSGPAPERRRNWILPTLEDGVGARTGDEPEVETGWGWLVDAIEAGRLEEEARTRDFAENEELEEDILAQMRAAEEEQADLLSALGAMNGAAPVLQNLADQRQLSDELINRMANMNADELREFLEAQQDPMGNNSPFGNVDPWSDPELRASAWSQSAGDSLFGGENWFGASASSGDRLFSSDWGESFSAWDSAAPSSAASGPDRVGRFTADSGFGGSSIGGAGTSAFDPTPVSSAGWSADWSGASSWQTDTFRSDTVTAPAAAPAVRSERERFDVQGSGWLADR